MRNHILSLMRIASLVPSATEALFSLGLGDDVVAVTHECDWPPAALERPRLTRSEIPDGLTPREIDAAVRELTAKGEAIYGLDSQELERLEPDLIVTQALCAVCAVSYDDVCQVAGTLPGDPGVLSLDPETLDEVLGDLVRLGAECGVPERGEQPSPRAPEAPGRRANGGRGGAEAARRRARVARPTVHRRPLGARDDRGRGGHRRARRGGRQVAHGDVGGASRSPRPTWRS